MSTIPSNMPNTTTTITDTGTGAGTTPTITRTKPLVALVTLGCKLNQSETDAIATELQNRGFDIIPHMSVDANYTVINTCTVTSKADRKSRNTIYKAIRSSIPNMLPNPSSAPSASTNTKKGIVIVTGCFVGSGMQEIENMQVDYIIDNSKKKYIPDVIESHEQGQIFNINAQKPDYFGYVAASKLIHTRQNLKIQDGCDNFCTFCIIPMVRGSATSRPIEQIIQQARTMIEQGTKEIILTGVNMSRYVYQEYTFSDVLEGLLKLPGTFRIRISSLEPDTIDERFYALMEHPKMCPHLHLCMQSGSDKILMKMRRMYNTKEFLNCVQKVKSINPKINLTTDVIVGFPGETEEDFACTINMLKDCEFSHTHLFPYSHREGTRASRMEEEVSIPIKKARMQTLDEINTTLKNQYRLSFEGATQTVLIERIQQNIAYGLTEYYLPVEIPASPQIKENELFTTQIVGHHFQKQEAILHGKIIQTIT